MKKVLFSPFLFLPFLLPLKATAQNWETVESDRVVEQLEQPEPLKVIGPDTPKPKLNRSFFPSICFYFQPVLQVGSKMGAGISAGGYVSNFNVEAHFTIGLTKSEDIYWIKGSDQRVCSYKPTAFSLRVGYGFIVADRLRLTPQVGLAVVGIKCSDGDSKGYAASTTIGLKGEYALSKTIALFVAPEVAFAASKSDVFKQLEDVSSKIKGWATGFNARLGVTITF